jgi:hypothetical protein
VRATIAFAATSLSPESIYEDECRRLWPIATWSLPAHGCRNATGGQLKKEFTAVIEKDAHTLTVAEQRSRFTPAATSHRLCFARSQKTSA